MDGRINVLELVKKGALGPDEKSGETPAPGSGGMATQDRPSHTSEPGPAGESMIPGTNCYRVIGTFVPGKDGMRLMVTVDGSKLTPKQALDHLRAMAASIVQQIQESASRIKIATEIPKGGPRG